MIILGLICLIVGWIVGISILTTIGIILLVIGLVLLIVGQFTPIAGRRYWY